MPVNIGGTGPFKRDLNGERGHPQKPWRRPELQKLAIAATSGAGAPKGQFNEGSGVGKGDSGPTPVS